MSSTLGRLGTGLAVALALAATPATVAAQTNVAGTWDLTVVTDGGEGTVTLVLTQAGDSISGQYTGSTFGQAAARGVVAGNQVTVRVAVGDPTGGQLGGGSLGTIVMVGTLSNPTTVSGTYALESDLLPLTGTFNGTKRAPGAAAPAAAPPATPPGG